MNHLSPGTVGTRAEPESSANRKGTVLVVAPQPFYEDRGTPIAIQHVVRAVLELGYQVDLLTYPLGTTVDIPGLRYIRVGNPLNFRSIPVSFSFRKLALDALLGLKCLQLLRRNNYVYVHAAEESAFIPAAFCRRHGSPILYDMASSLPEQLALKWFFNFRPLRVVFSSCERWLMHRVNLIVASAGLRGVVEKQAPDTPVQEWMYPVSPFRVPPEEIEAAREELGLTRDQKTVVYAGNFSSYQGIQLLLNGTATIAERCPQAVLVLLGARDAEERQEILSSVPATLRGHIRVLERKERSAVNRYLGLADVLVSPRSAGNNFPLKIFEYLSTGKPIVATRIPAHLAVLNDNLAIIVDVNSESVADGVIRALSDATLANKVGGNGKRFADDRLSWRSFVTMMDELISTLVSDTDQGGAGSANAASRDSA